MFDHACFRPYHTNRAGVRWASAFGKDLESYDLSITMRQLLAVLWRRDRLGVSDPGFDTSIEQSTLSRLLVAMEKRELATRERSAARIAGLGSVSADRRRSRAGDHRRAVSLPIPGRGCSDRQGNRGDRRGAASGAGSAIALWRPRANESGAKAGRLSLQ